MKDPNLTKSNMNSFFFEDPKNGPVEKQIEGIQLKYYYFNSEIKIKTESNKVLNGSLLLGDANLIYDKKQFILNQFDIFFVPPEKEIELKGEKGRQYKIVLIYSFIEEEQPLEFDIQHYNLENFVSRGKPSSNEIMSTFRSVWTAFKNDFFMSGITKIPNDSLKTGVVTSVNLEENKEKGKVELYSHIHPDFPEVYIFLIDDDNYAITQYLINSKGESVCKDLSNGDGVFFPGYLGHINFAKPYYKDLKFCSYIWFIPTFGKKKQIEPITLKV
ncbi:MAG: hypothetical protein ACFE9N_11385 [Promethearchaeota archaeon]